MADVTDWISMALGQATGPDWIIMILVGFASIFSLLAFLRSGKDANDTGREVREELRAGREEARAAGKELREEVAGLLQNTTSTLSTSIESATRSQQTALDAMVKQLRELDTSNRAALDRIRDTLDARVRELLESNEKKIAELRTTVTDGLKTTGETLAKSTTEMAASQSTRLEGVAKQLKELNESNQASLERVRATFDRGVKELQESNEKKLEEMRKTVDEKLHDTLEKRLGESFKIVSERLESVQRGLGEMQNLATGVGDLKRVLTNVKARGTWAEVQLGAILEQVLTADQFETNVIVKPETSERVEFAIRLPGPNDDPNQHVYLPIDSKFPQEDYARLQDATDAGDPVAVKAALDGLARSIRAEAKSIQDKYISPPATTDFAIMFLATEGLYAEVTRQPALMEELQQNYRVVVAGPTTLVAILSSLRMGFQTLAIEKRASEVWQVLAAVKTEFGKFGEVLAKVKKQLNTASSTIDKTEIRTRAMERKLRSVEQLPGAASVSTLELDDFGLTTEDESEVELDVEEVPGE